MYMIDHASLEELLNYLDLLPDTPPAARRSAVAGPRFRVGAVRRCRLQVVRDGLGVG